MILILGYQLSSKISLSMLVIKSRDWHEKWQSNFTHLNTHLKINFIWEKPLKCTSYIINNMTLILTSQNPNNLTCREFLKTSKFTCITSVCQLAIRLTSARHMGPIFCHKKGNHCLYMNLLHPQCHGLFFGCWFCSCLKQRCQNLTHHKHSTKGVNMYDSATNCKTVKLNSI